jgi:hypothetical protein
LSCWVVCRSWQQAYSHSHRRACCRPRIPCRHVHIYNTF